MTFYLLTSQQHESQTIENEYSGAVISTFTL